MKRFMTFLLEENTRKIEKGDTFYSIAKAQGVSVDDITKANQGLDPTKLQIGQSINLPGSKKKSPELTGLARYAADLKPDEGFRARKYDDHKGNPTVGYGHMIAPDSKKRFEAAGIGDQYHGVCVAGTCGLSEKDADTLLQQDIKDIYLPRAKGMLPNFDKLNVEAQSAVINTTFRGGLGGSPNTQKLLRQAKFDPSKFKEAAEELKKHKGYNKSKREGTGVYKRMDKTSDAFSRASYTK